MGKQVVYTTGRAGDEQLYALNVADLWNDAPRPAQLTRHATGIGNWQFSPDGRKVYFVTPDSIDRDDRARQDKQFTVRPREPQSSLQSLWVYDLDTRQEKKLVGDTNYQCRQSYDFQRRQVDRVPRHVEEPYERGNLEQNDYADLYLYNVASGSVERLSKNDIISEGAVSFSPDSKTLAFSAPDDFKFEHNSKIYLRAVDQPGARSARSVARSTSTVRVGGGRGGGEGVESSFWSQKGDSIYFGTGKRATTQFFVSRRRPAT
jgi:Tol biopolymer transport system component